MESCLYRILFLFQLLFWLVPFFLIKPLTATFAVKDFRAIIPGFEILNMVEDFEGFERKKNHTMLANPYTDNIWLDIDYIGRTGNQVLQMLRALKTCKMISCRAIRVHGDYFFGESPVTYRGIKIGKNIKMPKDYVQVKSRFWSEAFDAIDMDRTEDIEFLQELIKSRSKKVDIDPNALYVHVRTGDTYTRWACERYGQPPLCFYKAAEKLKNFTKKVIISEDERGPIVPALLKDGYVRPKTTLWEDIYTLTHAHNIVGSSSTLFYGMNLLSFDPNRTVIAYNAHQHLQYQNINQKGFLVNETFLDKVDYVCDPSPEYAEKIIKFWRHTPDNEAIMLSEKCELRKVSKTHHS